ncbi:ABC transporter permease [Nocardioides sp. 1609]|uniref:ABC transporter permease n=1 Tax=Nocardioides sp. 1609 TaxID=2508327 RepID=UPI00106F98DC|nr:ABC transporter permease [Nocardioides sp. 1609]
MLGFIVRRLLSSLLVIGLASFVVFAIFYLGPSNPAQPICEGAGGRCTPERLEAIEKQMGLDKPVVSAYGEFMGGIVKGREIDFGASQYDCDAPCFGISFGTRTPVTDELKERIVPTVLIAVGGSIVFLVVGVSIGIAAAARRGSAGDRLLVSGSLLVSSVPYYLVCLLAWIFLTLQTSLFPDTGYFPITEDPLKTFGGLLLPCLVLGVATSPSYARYTRGQMVETLGDDYIRTATAKGLPRRTVLFRHALRAAIVPIVTIFGLDFGALLAGTIFTETIFSIDGIGRWGLQALQAPLDLPVLTATVLVGALFIVLSNLIVDVVYGFLDPRVRLG